MPRSRRSTRLAPLFALAGLLGATAPGAAEQYMVGDRWFPSTALTADPFVADAIYSGFEHLRQSGTGGYGGYGGWWAPPNFGADELSVGFEKRITEQLGISFAGTYDIQTPRGQSNVYGWNNPYATIKYQALEDVPHEALVSIGVEREFGGVGASRVGAEGIGYTTPTLYAAKGFGDLPDEMKFLRPFAVTGTFGVQVPDQRLYDGVPYADMAVTGLSLQYSLHYLQGNVEYVGLPPFVDRLIPIVEFTYSAPVSAMLGNPSTGLVAPGIVYSNNGIDLSLEALLPLNHASGIGVGVIAKAHIPLDRIAGALGKPLFGD